MTMNKIKTLTEEQKQLMYEVRDEWINRIGNIPLDKQKAKEGIDFMYRVSELEPPKKIIFVNSPLAMQQVYSLLKKMSDFLETGTIDKVIEEVVKEEFKSIVRKSEERKNNNSLSDNNKQGNTDILDKAINKSLELFKKTTNTKFEYQSLGSRGSVIDWSWVAYYDYFSRIGVELDSKFYEFRDKCCLSGMFDMLLYKEVAIVCEHPSVINWEIVNGQKIASSRTGPAIQWEDGFSVYQIEGVRVPSHVVTNPDSITLEEINNEQNLEVQRIMIQQMGIDKYLELSSPTLLDVDNEGLNGGARILVKTKAGKWLIATDGSTNRIYYLSVEEKSQSCSSAHESLCGFDESLIKLEG